MWEAFDMLSTGSGCLPCHWLRSLPVHPAACRGRPAHRRPAGACRGGGCGRDGGTQRAAGGLARLQGGQRPVKPAGGAMPSACGDLQADSAIRGFRTAAPLTMPCAIAHAGSVQASPGGRAHACWQRGAARVVYLPAQTLPPSRPCLKRRCWHRCPPPTSCWWPGCQP